MSVCIYKDTHPKVVQQCSIYFCADLTVSFDDFNVGTRILGDRLIGFYMWAPRRVFPVRVCHVNYWFTEMEN